MSWEAVAGFAYSKSLACGFRGRTRIFCTTRCRPSASAIRRYATANRRKAHDSPTRAAYSRNRKQDSSMRRFTMASKYSPEAEGSPILIAGVAAAGLLLLLEAIHLLPDIIASFTNRPQAAFIALALVALLLILSERSSGLVSRSRHEELESEMFHEQ